MKENILRSMEKTLLIRTLCTSLHHQDIREAVKSYETTTNLKLHFPALHLHLTGVSVGRFWGRLW